VTEPPIDNVCLHEEANEMLKIALKGLELDSTPHSVKHIQRVARCALERIKELERLVWLYERTNGR
jgi:hypothetical protein